MADSDEESFHSASEGLEEEDFDTIKDEKNIPKVETSKAKYSEEKEIVGVEENEKILKPSDNTKVEAKQENQPTKQIDQNEIREKSNIEDDVPIKEDDVPINKKEEKIPSNEGWDTFEDEDQKSSPEVTENDWDDDWKAEFEPTTSLDTIEKEKSRQDLPKEKIRQDLPKEKARQDLPKEKKSTTTDDDWFAKQLTESSKSPPKQSSIWDWSGFNDVVTAVGEGFSTVVENSFGLPNPEEMARISVAERRKLLEEAQNIKEPEPSLSSDESIPSPDYTRSNSNVPLNSLGGLFSGLVSGSLDVLETLGKKTFETLTVKDDAEKRRFIFQPGKQENLSEVLRELRANDDETNSPAAKHTSLGYGSTVMEKFNTNFVSLFEKSGGMVHLEGLELLSSGKEKELSGFANSREFDNLLSNFCLEDVSECSSEDFEIEFRKSIRGIGLPYKAENVISVNQDLTQELLSRQATVDAGEEIVVDAIHEAAICALAKLTAHAIQALHKFAQLILIEQPNMPFIFAFTYLICRRLSFYASQYANILSLTNSSDNVDEVVTNIFYECTNACHYLKKALELLRPFVLA
uniref:Protein FAM114A2 n=2 Tax=Acrobeloides nanus TaxID=290746 RepID=A0A914DCT8_9BILA